MLRLLCVTAHPDDEAGCFGGILARYAEAGVACSLLCLTAGERASNRGAAGNDDELKAIRREELARSCRHLGVAQHELFDFPDGGLARESFYEVSRRLVAAMRRLRPHVVVTFGGEGYVTAHTDHGMTSLFTTAAFQWAPRPKLCPEQLTEGLQLWQPRKLYYTTAAYWLDERPAIALAPITARVDVAPYVQRKLEAFQQHTSQLPLLPIFEHAQRQAGNDELFHLAATASITAASAETDLFAGIVDQD